jgi:hypothetical protein
MTDDPVAVLDDACLWLRLGDDMTARLAGQPLLNTAPVRASLGAIAGWLRRHPAAAADIGLNMPGSTP